MSKDKLAALAVLFYFAKPLPCSFSDLVFLPIVGAIGNPESSSTYPILSSHGHCNPVWCTERPSMPPSSPCGDILFDPDWDPNAFLLVNVGATTFDGYSTCSDFVMIGDSLQNLLGELGMYNDAPQLDRLCTFQEPFRESNWHAKTWRLGPHKAFLGPKMGPKVTIPRTQVMPTFVEFFLSLWTTSIQIRLVKQTNLYS